MLRAVTLSRETLWGSSINYNFRGFCIKVMAGVLEAGARLAAKLGGKVGLKAATEDFAKVFAKTGGKSAVRGDEMLAEGLGDMGEMEAKIASSATKTAGMEAKMAAEGASESVARNAGSAAARDTEALAAATEKAAV